MEYLKCNFSHKTSRNEGKVKMNDIEIGISRSRNFWYLGSIIQDEGELVEDTTNRIKVG